MVPTAVLVHNSTGAIETFEAYQCRRVHCTRHYEPGRGYFDITDPNCEYVEDQAAGHHVCPCHREVLFVRWSEGGYGYLYQCPVPDCDFTEPYQPLYRVAKAMAA
jgi:hypothetical protein